MAMKRMLACIDKFLNMVRDKGLTEQLLNDAEPYLEHIAQSFRITHLQAALFAYIFDFTVFNHVTSLQAEIPTLYEALKCSRGKYLEYLNEIDILAKKNLIHKEINDYSLPVYQVPREIIFSLRKGFKVKPASYQNMGIQRFFKVLEGLFRSRAHDEMTLYELEGRLSALLRDNPQLKIVQKINSLKLSKNDKQVLLYFCNKAVSEDKRLFGAAAGVVTYDALMKQFSDEHELFDAEEAIINPLRKGSHPLQRLKYIEEVNEDCLASTDGFVLTDKAKNDILAKLKQKIKTDDGNLLKASGIKAKAMFYNAGDEAKIEKLVKLLEPARFREVKKAMEKQGLRKGFACLFSGGPGTGKTETVYQIARRTKRDIFRVDIAAVRSKWVSESEKNIKALFDRYRSLVKGCRKEPILLFNEADAVIGKRSNCEGTNKTIQRMENTMQNIILEEMENLEGIMIATTNLAVNLDKAFERRFLYKIEFSKPDAQTRGCLWRNMMDALPEDTAQELAEKFEFSGGQIENIVRKRQIDLILEGREPTVAELIGYCNDESMVKEKEGKIGFAAK